MCGIAGIIGNSDEGITRRMLENTRHRGPDDTGMYVDGQCAIGMNRLAIIDLSDAGHQPMTSDDGRYTIVYNGEIYNFKEIRRSLEAKGVTFRSHTDTEVLLKGYIAYGEDILQKIRGMFAFVIWDKTQKKAFGARDHMGIKPFLYHHRDGVFIFSSEMKGMLANPLVARKLSSQGLQLFLSYGYVGAPYTIIENVFALKPGECFTLADNKMSIRTYWDIPAFRRTSMSYDACRQTLKELVIGSVKEELVSDVPLGLFLSGGLDSAVVLSAMRLAGKERIDTFSLGFENFGVSEEAEAEVVARHFGTNHHTHIVSGKTVAAEFGSFIEAMDQPCIDGLNVYLVSKYTRQHVTVALSGLGPDELFLGYKWQRSAIPPAWFSKPVQQLFLAFLPVLKKIWPPRFIGVLHYFTQVHDPLLFYRQLNRILTCEEIQALMGSDYHPGLNDAYVSMYDLPGETELYSRISRLDMKLFMAARVLSISDTTSMYHSLEVRFPLIDKKIVEFSRTLPPEFKMNLEKAAGIKPWSTYEGAETYEGSGVKKILYEAFKTELPAGFGLRAKKGFKFPYEQWMKNELKDFTTSRSVLKNAEQSWHKLILDSWISKNNIETSS